MKPAFEPAPSVAVPIAGTDLSFPVRRIYCVGRNYAAHAREMGSDPQREPPFFFCKPADAILYVAPGRVGVFPYPAKKQNCHYEVEQVVAIGKRGRDIPVDAALEHVYGYALGLDMTRRDLQVQMRDSGRPWDIGKAFDHSAPIGPIHRAEDVGHLQHGAIWLRLNGEMKQESNLADRIWPVAETIACLSTFFELVPGDLIYTGTPEGVGAVQRGDRLRAGIDGLGELDLDVA